MKSVFKRGGWLALCVLAVLLFLGIQTFATYLWLIILSFSCGARGLLDVFLDQTVRSAALTLYFQSFLQAMLLYQLIAVAVFLPWWWFGFARRERGMPRPCVRGIHLGGIALMAGSLQFVIAALLAFVSVLFPDLLAEYEQMMERAGINELSLLTVLFTTVLAPIVEELACRGVILGLAQKVSRRFWVANVIQALCFGILHMNLVQGAYAFLLGLVLGAIWQRFRRLSCCMLFHLVFNGLSFVLPEVPEGMGPVGMALLLLLSCAVLALGCRLAEIRPRRSLTE